MQTVLNSLASAYGFVFFTLWGLVLAIYALLHISERLSPAERCSYRSMMTNARITAVFSLFNPICQLTVYFIVSYVAACRLQWLGAPLVDHVFDGLPRAITVLIGLTVSLIFYDFFYYWFHRLQHAIPMLWEQHKLHHTDAAVNVTTTFRHHWLETLFKWLFISVAMTLILPVKPAFIAAAATATFITNLWWGAVVHMNVRLPFGPFTRIITGPQYHRIHHSRLATHADKNFASFFPLLDMLFGTFYHPGDEFPATGVVGEPTDPSLGEIIFGPFRQWARCVNSRAKSILARLAA